MTSTPAHPSTGGGPATSYDVRIWSVQPYERKRGRTYGVRWSVANERQHRTFTSRALADSFRAELITATRQGTLFDVESGLPLSAATRQEGTKGATWYEHACDYVDAGWSRLAPSSRRSIADVLATITPALLPLSRDRPQQGQLRAALYQWSFNTARRKAGPPDPALVPVVRWVDRNSLPLNTVEDPVALRQVLDALAVNLDGKPAAATVVARRRTALYSALRLAVERGRLPGNPLDSLRWKAPRMAASVDMRSVVNHEQARALLAAVRSQGPRGERLIAFFGCMYYSALRPAEASELREGDLLLPPDGVGWGELRLHRSSPATARSWADAGEQAPRQLKHRALKDVRPVPCPPPLTRLLVDHLREHGTAADGRLFRALRDGGQLPDSVYGRVWEKARQTALTSAEAKSPLAARPYDLRHAAVSTWLNAGVDPTQVAEWAGHSVAVLLRVYAKCIVGRDELARQRVAAMLGLDDDKPG